jgi:hypothetical protein
MLVKLSDRRSVFFSRTFVYKYYGFVCAVIDSFFVFAKRRPDYFLYERINNVTRVLHEL